MGTPPQATDHLKAAVNLLLSLNEEEPDPRNRPDTETDRFLVDLAGVHAQIALVGEIRLCRRILEAYVRGNR